MWSPKMCWLPHSSFHTYSTPNPPPPPPQQQFSPPRRRPPPSLPLRLLRRREQPGARLPAAHPLQELPLRPPSPLQLPRRLLQLLPHLLHRPLQLPPRHQFFHRRHLPPLPSIPIIPLSPQLQHLRLHLRRRPAPLQRRPLLIRYVTKLLTGPLSNLPVCPALTLLNLSTNSFDPLPHPSPRAALPSLEVLDLSHNNISDDSSASWLLSALKHLSLRYNNLAGILPEFNHKSLLHLDLTKNNISDNFLKFTDCSALEHLDLSSNRFSSDVGTSFSSCPNLAFLNLTDNRRLYLSDNRHLYLSDNDFQVVPPSLSDSCTTLIELDLMK